MELKNTYMLRHTIIGAICISIIVMTSDIIKAQDAHLSQFDTSPLYINPATTGMHQAEYRIIGNYRGQWSSITNHPYVTTATSFDMPRGKYAFGGIIMDNKAGVGGLNVFNFMLSGSYEIMDDPKKYNHLSVGLQAGMIHKSIKPGNFSYDNQYTNASGGGFDVSLPVGEAFATNAGFIPDVNMGVFYYNSNQEIKVAPFGGFSLSHVLSPKETFLNEENRLPRKWLMHGGANFYLMEDLIITPRWLYMAQTNDRELMFSLLGTYEISKQGISAMLGASYRNKDALVIQMGMIYKDYNIKVSYDINTSSLNTVSNSNGGFEVSIIYYKPLSKRLPSLY